MKYVSHILYSAIFGALVSLWAPATPLQQISCLPCKSVVASPEDILVSPQGCTVKYTYLKEDAICYAPGLTCVPQEPCDFFINAECTGSCVNAVTGFIDCGGFYHSVPCDQTLHAWLACNNFCQIYPFIYLNGELTWTVNGLGCQLCGTVQIADPL